MNLFTDGFNEAIKLLASGDDSVYSAISTTLTVSSWSLLISLLIGLPLGFFLGYYNFPGKTIIRTIVDTLLALPTVVIGLVAYTMLSQVGPFGNFDLLFSQKAIIIGQIVLGLPIIIALRPEAAISTVVQERSERDCGSTAAFSRRHRPPPRKPHTASEAPSNGTLGKVQPRLNTVAWFV